MKLLLSGEGPTDIGMTRPGTAGPEFVPGPMAWIVDRLLEHGYLDYSVLGSHLAGGECVVHVRESVLAAMKEQGALLLPGAKRPKGKTFYRKNALLLGQYAKEIAVADDMPVIAVLFRDGDGTSSTPATEWQEKFDSMREGFAIAGCTTGVPMVPRPKSEAWLLCALRQPGYANCHPLEDASGNDASPNSLKAQVALLCGGVDPSGADQADWVISGQVDPLRIDMPSFNAFKQALCAAAENAGLLPLR